MLNTSVLIDDEAPFVQALARQLTWRKLKVLSAPGGSEALDVLENESR
jgi:ActR/RegA family two-component response regulator